jgi:hypothetical protein
MWGLGSTLPHTIDNFGGSSAAEYGSLNPQEYYVTGGGGATHAVIDTYRRILPYAPC